MHSGYQPLTKPRAIQNTAVHTKSRARSFLAGVLTGGG